MSPKLPRFNVLPSILITLLKLRSRGQLPIFKAVFPSSVFKQLSVRRVRHPNWPQRKWYLLWLFTTAQITKVKSEVTVLTTSGRSGVFFLMSNEKYFNSVVGQFLFYRYMGGRLWGDFNLLCNLFIDSFSNDTTVKVSKCIFFLLFYLCNLLYLRSVTDD